MPPPATPRGGRLDGSRCEPSPTRRAACAVPARSLRPAERLADVAVNGSDSLFYVRFRTTGRRDAPVAKSVLGRDYVNAHGRTTGTIPAFDRTADRDFDGYLSDAEFARRRPGFDARFAYESRLFYPAYGQMRFATNPANGGFRNWAVDFAKRFLAQHPGADGLFLDNSYGRLQVDARILQESTAKYADDYASLAGSIDAGIGKKWVLREHGRQRRECRAAHEVRHLVRRGIRAAAAVAHVAAIPRHGRS